MSLRTKQVYQECVRETGVTGVIGMTVQKVDAAQTTRNRLGTEIVAEYDPSLLNTRSKRELVAQVKSEKFPAGTGFEGVHRLFLDDRKRSPEDRYVHDYHYIPHENEPDSFIIITFVPSLMRLIHKVKTFEGDFTFKRLILLYEWEMVIWYPTLQRTLTIGRFYTNRQTEANYQILFDRLQIQIETLTGYPIRFKRLVPDGNIHFMMTDMEVAQIIGCSKSIMKQNDPAFSKITTVDPHRFAPEVIRVCYVHSIRAVKDFEKYVNLGKITKNDFRKLLDFPSLLMNRKSLEDFDLFVCQLKVDEITAWWSHKYSSKDGYLLKCICKGLSPIPAADLYNTINDTNRGESQHAWTARQTGTGLSPVEGIISARRLDEQVAREVAIELKSGVRKNRNNDSTNRNTRAMGRKDAAARKAEASNQRAEIQDQIDALKAGHRESLQHQKELETRLDAVQGSKAKSKQKLGLDRAQSSSSGCVKSRKDKQTVSASPAPPSCPAPIDMPSQDMSEPGVQDVLGDTVLPGLFSAEIPSGFYNLPHTSSSSSFASDFEPFIGDINSETGFHSDFGEYPPSDSYYGSDYLSEGYISDSMGTQSYLESTADVNSTVSESVPGSESVSATVGVGNLSDNEFLAMLEANSGFDGNLGEFNVDGLPFVNNGYIDPLFNIPSPLSSPDRYDQRLPAPSPAPPPVPVAVEMEMGPENSRKRRRTADDLAHDAAEVCDWTRARRKTNRSMGISGIGDERDTV
ncbi:hypothetical protein VNI00_017410 [Paramarasmius palmivorus]|uniref:Uncharacterized protein n=1 Tax=Paramarasmius palmivorus TaxID=297713 RepID=A0AAW0B671_9AGAR